MPAAPPLACRLQNGSDVTEGQWEVFGIQTSDAVTIPPVHFLYEGLFFFLLFFQPSICSPKPRLASCVRHSWRLIPTCLTSDV